MIDSNEKQEMIDYCNDILKFSPVGSKEYHFAKIALLEISGGANDALEVAEEIKNNASENSIQSKIASIVLDLHKKKENVDSVPLGWKLVPLEPVEEMFRFIPAMVKMVINQDEYDLSGLNERNATWIYKSMLKYIPNNR